MLVVKSLHIIFMVTWFAGLFYLPRLFVYHAQAAPDDTIGIERFKVMERRLYSGIMTPAAALTIAFGLWLWLGYGISGGWLHVKMALVALLMATRAASAQVTTGFITGTVQDGQGGVIPGATVALISEARGTRSAPTVTPDEHW